MPTGWQPERPAEGPCAPQPLLLTPAAVVPCCPGQAGLVVAPERLCVQGRGGAPRPTAGEHPGLSSAGRRGRGLGAP